MKDDKLVSDGLDGGALGLELKIGCSVCSDVCELNWNGGEYEFSCVEKLQLCEFEKIRRSRGAETLFSEILLNGKIVFLSCALYGICANDVVYGRDAIRAGYSLGRWRRGFSCVMKWWYSSKGLLFDEISSLFSFLEYLRAQSNE
uniref:Uncharacterized protein n=1 Tax=Octopus bimaculoides TaxID=37653 RepID=A0A0L8FGF4_OCTBM